MNSAEERLKQDLDINVKSPYIKLDKDMKYCTYTRDDLTLKEYYDKSQKDDDIQEILNQNQQLKDNRELLEEWLKEKIKVYKDINHAIVYSRYEEVLSKMQEIGDSNDRTN